jgi:hypothetical protein
MENRKIPKRVLLGTTQENAVPNKTRFGFAHFQAVNILFLTELESFQTVSFEKKESKFFLAL